VARHRLKRVFYLVIAARGCEGALGLGIRAAKRFKEPSPIAKMGVDNRLGLSKRNTHIRGLGLLAGVLPVYPALKRKHGHAGFHDLRNHPALSCDKTTTLWVRLASQRGNPRCAREDGVALAVLQRNTARTNSITRLSYCAKANRSTPTLNLYRRRRERPRPWYGENNSRISATRYPWTWALPILHQWLSSARWSIYAGAGSDWIL